MKKSLRTNWGVVVSLAGKDEMKQDLRPGETRVMAVHEVQNNPQFISTNRHIMQGFLNGILKTQIVELRYSMKKISSMSLQ